MDPFEVYAYWDSWRTSPNLTLTLTLKTEKEKKWRLKISV